MKKPNEERVNELLSNCLDYLSELWERLDEDEYNNEWKNIIGLTDEEMEYYSLNREE